jgi:endonuclease-3 related protein
MDDKKTTQTLLAIYNRLINHYGPQKWWPADEPFEVIIGAILTQSTAWTNVEKAINNLKTADRLSSKGIRELSHTELAELIRPSGYFNAKAKKLQAFCRWFAEKYNDSLQQLFSNETVRLREQLLDVHGIGEETADSIILYAAGKPVFVIDTYTRRFIGRIGLTPYNYTYNGYQKLFENNLPADTELFNEYHALLVCLSKDVCRKNPLCERCCLNSTTANNTNVKYPCSTLITG